MAASHYLLGENFFVYTGDSTKTPIGYSTECTLSISGDTIDVSSKNSGVFAAALPGQFSWTISTSALYTTEAQFETLYTAMLKREPMKITFGRVTSLGDATTDINTDLASEKTHFDGVGYLTSLELNAGNGECASYSLEIQGDGKLTMTKGTE